MAKMYRQFKQKNVFNVYFTRKLYKILAYFGSYEPIKNCKKWLRTDKIFKYQELKSIVIFEMMRVIKEVKPDKELASGPTYFIS